VYEIRIDGGDDALKERVARMLCPDEDHPPPCPVPWSCGYDGEAVVFAIYAAAETAARVAERVRAVTSRTVTLVDGDPADHEDLVVQHRVESARR
jgi:hypothetical protein